MISFRPQGRTLGYPSEHRGAGKLGLSSRTEAKLLVLGLNKKESDAELRYKKKLKRKKYNNQTCQKASRPLCSYD